MGWATEDSPRPSAQSPLGEAQCVPCIALFNPVFIENQMSVTIDGSSHLNHYIVQTEADVTFFLQPAVIDSVAQLGIVVLITRDTFFDVFVNDTGVEESIVRGLKQIDAKGDSIGLISVSSTKYTIAGATRLVV
jgi:hypothetical protein